MDRLILAVVAVVRHELAGPPPCCSCSCDCTFDVTQHMRGVFFMGADNKRRREDLDENYQLANA
jgi:hypothetical protein